MCLVELNRSWSTARYRGRELRRGHAWDSNVVDVDSGEWFWLSGPRRDETDTRYGPSTTTVDDDVREVYEAFLAGAALPGRERG